LRNTPQSASWRRVNGFNNKMYFKKRQPSTDVFYFRNFLKIFVMQELVNKLMAEGLTEQQAYKAIEIIKNFAKDKFPIFGGAIDKLFDKYGPKDDEDDIMP
jgi:hypothetical protein